MGGDGSDVDCFRGFSSLFGQTNCEKYILSCCGQRMGMTSNKTSPIGGRDVAHQIINS